MVKPVKNGALGNFESIDPSKIIARPKNIVRSKYTLPSVILAL
jgi:hypothetical protein